MTKPQNRDNPERFAVPYSTWESCTPEYVTHLPDDIDGIKVYVLDFDPEKRLRSSADGRN